MTNSTIQNIATVNANIQATVEKQTATIASQFKFNHKQALTAIEKIGKQQGAIAKDIRVLCEDLILRFKLAGDLTNPATGGLGDTTLLNELMVTLYNTRGAWERVGVWFIKHTGGALKFNKDDKWVIEKIKGKAFIVGDIDDLPHPLDKFEKGEPTQEALDKKEKARLNYDKRVLSLLDKLEELAKEYQDDITKVITNPDVENKPKLEVTILAKLEAITGVKLQTVESVLKSSK
jgi:hypothetical protein